MPRPKNNRDTEGIRRMIHQHLQRRAMVAPPLVADMHLDEDSFSAFVEGRLTETESAPVIQHLVSCGFCRRITAQLVRLESEIGPPEESAPETTTGPNRLERLKDLVSRVLPQSEGDAVFAYHAPAEDFKRKSDATTDESSDEKSEDKTEDNESPDE